MYQTFLCDITNNLLLRGWMEQSLQLRTGTFPTTSLGAYSADRISALCFTACVLRSPDDTHCNFALGLSPKRRWENAPCVCAVKPNRALSALHDFHNLFFNLRHWSLDDLFKDAL